MQVSHPSDLGLDVGHKICVKYFGRDPVNGKHRISRKALLNIPVGVESSSTTKGQQHAGSDQVLVEALEGADVASSGQSRKTEH